MKRAPGVERGHLTYVVKPRFNISKINWKKKKKSRRNA